MSGVVFGATMAICTILVIGLILALVLVIVNMFKKKGEKPLTLLDRIEFITKKDMLRHDGVIQDADTVLADIMQTADFEITGLGKEIFEIYKKTRDKEAFEDLFYSLSGETFEEYIGRCEKV